MPAERSSMEQPMQRFEGVKLAQAPLLEVIVVVHADFEQPYALVPGAFAALQGDSEVPSFEELFIAGPNARPMHRFTSENNLRLVQLGPGLVSVHQRGEYTRFEDFQHFVEQQLAAVFEIAKPRQIRRLGLRYINLVSLEHGAGAPLAFSLPPTALFPEVPAEKLESYGGRRQTAEDGGSLGVAIEWPRSYERPEANETLEGILLDLDFFKVEPECTGIEECMSWLETAHESIYQAFRRTIGEELHGLFHPQATASEK